MAIFLLELFSEEIPSRMQRQAAEQLQRLLVAGLEKNGLSPQGVKTYVSPRHLAFSCSDLPIVQPDVREERKGPKIGSPEQAMKGFLGATGLTVEQCEQRDGYYFATIERKGRPTGDVLKAVVEEALNSFGWPKSMRWGSRPLSWVRPLHSIVCLLDDKIVPVQFAHIAAGNVTHGHRFLAPGAITIAHADRYVEGLKASYVVVDYAARRAQIAAEITALSAAAKLTIVPDEALLDEVTGLVEWPVPLLGEFDSKFLSLPPEVLISEMKVHQRYFALQDAQGKLSNQFIAVANMVTEDGGKRVIAGNARVLRARLSDGEFYWEQDRKKSLADWGNGLKDVVFHAKVGMMDAKVARIEALALAIAKEVGYGDAALVSKAALLCKADLTSGMVGEFPELQGIMGRYYATAQNENAAVADAIRDHYKPLGASDSVPDAPLAAIVAVADKLDSIISLFAAGEKPTGSKDPLALRRAALGILRIVLQHNWKIDLLPIIATGSILSHLAIEKLTKVAVAKELFTHYEKDILSGHFSGLELLNKNNDDALLHFINKKIDEVRDFFCDRLQYLMRDQGLRHDIIEVSLTSKGDYLDVCLIVNSANNMLAWVASEKGKLTLAAIKRVLNILAAEEKKDKKAIAANAALAGALKLPAEQKIAAVLQQKGDVTLATLEALAEPINQFFTDVLVTEPEFKDARLALLAAVRAQALQVADFSKIEG